MHGGVVKNARMQAGDRHPTGMLSSCSSKQTTHQGIAPFLMSQVLGKCAGGGKFYQGIALTLISQVPGK